MLEHIVDSTENTVDNIETNKRLKSGMFHEAFIKTGIDGEGLTRITPKLSQSIDTALAKANPQQYVRALI